MMKSKMTQSPEAANVMHNSTSRAMQAEFNRLLAANAERRLCSAIDDKSLVALEYHLNQYGASLQRIFYDSAKLDMALKEIFGEGPCVDNGFHSDHLTAAIESLWRRVTNE